MPDLYLYSDPAQARLELTLDSGQVIDGEPCVANGREDAHRFPLAEGTLGQGVTVHYVCDGYVPTTVRGILTMPTGEAPYIRFDDLKMVVAPTAPPAPPPRDPTLDPFPVCQAVYAQGDFDLSTKEGCGLYTEACCTALNTQQSPLWGHIRKAAAQNQWNGHAVDAIQLLAKAGHTDAGIYDIVWSTESPDAEPAWSYKGDADPNLWYYGPMPCPPA